MNQQPTRAEVLARVDLFLAALTQYCNEKNTCKHLYKVVLHAQVGPKNIRIVRQDQWPDQEPTGGSAHCFIDAATGNILKADGWKKPAPQIRGNIFKDDFDIGVGKAVGEFGAAYLR